MLKNIIAVAFVIVFLIEMFFAAAGSAHRKKKKLKDWNVVTGKIKSMEKIEDEYDLQCYEKAMKLYKEDDKTFTLDEVERELGLD